MKLLAASLTIASVIFSSTVVQASSPKLNDIRCDKFLGFAIPGSCKVVKKQTVSQPIKKRSRFGRRAAVRVSPTKCQVLGGKFDNRKKLCVLK